MCYCPTPTLHLNLALTGDAAFLLSLKKTHSVWFISVLNYGDTENVLINHLLLVIPMSYPCHYTNLCPHKPHKHAHTHTHTALTNTIRVCGTVTEQNGLLIHVAQGCNRLRYHGHHRHWIQGQLHFGGKIPSVKKISFCVLLYSLYWKEAKRSSHFNCEGEANRTFFPSSVMFVIFTK